MPILVQKFGGTSVANAEKIKRAAQRAIDATKAGYQVVVVVSARGKKTDELIDLANEITDKQISREMDVLLSIGEQETTALAAMAVYELGGKAMSMTGGQMGILTDSSHQRARIRRIDAEKMKSYLDQGYIIFAAGFQGVDELGDITTLGRGGSDTTAAALAAVLKAERCDIYTDVEGVFTTDPRVVSEARKIEHISYDEMLELASLGAGVMHSRSIEFAKKYRVPLRVRPSFNDGEGTLIAQAPLNDPSVVTGIALVKNEVRVSCREIPDRPGVISTIFAKMAQRKIAVDLVVQDIGKGGFAEVSFTVAQDDLAETLIAADAAIKELGAGKVTSGINVSKLSIVGNGMQTHTGVAAQMFKTLADQGVNIAMISTGEVKISVLIDRDQAVNASKAVHQSFALQESKRPDPSFGWKQSEDAQTAAAELMLRDQKELEIIQSLDGMEDIVVSEIEVDTEQARVTLQRVPDRIGICSQIFVAVAQGGIMVDMIVQNVSEDGMSNLSFTVPRQELDQTLILIRDVIKHWGYGELSYDRRITKISVVGIGVRSHTGVGDKMFRALAESGVNIEMISTSEMRISMVVKHEAAEVANKALRKAFGLRM
jgi:aspartate kinase